MSHLTQTVQIRLNQTVMFLRTFRLHLGNHWQLDATYSPSGCGRPPDFLRPGRFVLHEPLAEPQSHPVICTNLMEQTNRSALKVWFGFNV